MKTLLTFATLVVALPGIGCGGDPTAGPDVGESPSETPGAPDAGISTLPPLETQYKDARRIVEFTTTGLSCATICGRNEGRCSADGDSDPENPYNSDPATCFGRADYYIPRSHYEDEYQNYFPNQWLGCDEVAEPTYTGGYTLYAVECCCMLEEPHRLANDVEAPTSCDDVCAERGLECRAYDRCREIPGLCSDSFPEFFVESIAHYDEDEGGTGMETYPACDQVPASNRLLSHTCMCF